MGTYDLKTDESLEQKGVWNDLGEYGNFLLARSGGANDTFARKAQALYRKHRKAMEHGILSDSAIRGELARIYAETVVLNWKGVTGKDGKVLKYSILNAEKILKDIPELFRILMDCSSESAAYRQNVLEEEAGNSSSASSTR